MPRTIQDAATLAELERRIRSLQPDSPRLWGTMTPASMLCHVADVLAQAVGKREETDRSNVFTRVLLRPLVLHVMPMPKGAPTGPGLDPTKGGTKPEGFEQDRDRVLSLLAENASRPAHEPFATHPFFGPMNHAERGILTWKHTDHHLRQFGV